MMPASGMIGRSVLASIRACRVLHDGSWPASVPWRVCMRRRGRVSGELPRVPSACTPRRGTFQAGGECIAAPERGSNPRTAPDMHVAGARVDPVRAGPAAVPGGRPYTAGLVSQRPAFGCLFEIVETLVLTLIIFLVIQNFVAQPYKVQQQSMERTLEPEQYVLVDKLTPRFDDVQARRHRRVQAAAPTGATTRRRSSSGSSARAATPSRSATTASSTSTTSSSTSRTSTPTTTGRRSRRPPRPTRRRWTIPDGELFLMGDHRSNSADSRTFGPVQVDQVIGRAWLRYWPLDTFGVLQTPTYPELATDRAVNPR